MGGFPGRLRKIPRAVRMGTVPEGPRAHSGRMKNKFSIIALLTGVLLTPLAVDAVSAQGRGRGQGQGQGQGQQKKDDKDKKDDKKADTKAVGQFVFNDRDRGLVNRHFTANLPPGLAKRGGDLPPGLEKQLRRNGTLPPGLQKRIRPFPRTLLDQLRPLPSGYRYGIVDEHVIIYRPDNFLIGDVILHVVR